MRKKPLILVTNDDGITSPGICHLVGIAKRFGDVVVVAPDSPQSGMGHAITIEDPLRLRKVHLFGPEVPAYECSGTPVDCVKLAKNVLFKDKKIDLCLSGINHGSNAGINIIYSGTMSAAMEASLEGIDSIGFSHLNYGYDVNFSKADIHLCKIIQYALDNGLPHGRLLNVNIPDMETTDIKGIRICKQGESTWVESFSEGKDPRNRPYYWLTGKFVRSEISSDTDHWALDNGYISVVPSMHDLTDYAAIDALKDLHDDA